MALTTQATVMSGRALSLGIGLTLGLAAASPALATEPAKVAFDDSGAVAQPVSETKGDPAKGREWFTDRKLGNCLACHANPDLADLPFHGEVGPSMDGVADRWSEAELRGIVINPKKTFSDETIMPAFYRADGFKRPLEDFEGKTILTAEQVEDVVAYLMTLKEN